VVLEAVQQSWFQAKRRTNVMLVVDTSGSMEGDKITNVKQALKIFIEQIQNDQERVGMVLFPTRPITPSHPRNCGRIGGVKFHD